MGWLIKYKEITIAKTPWFSISICVKMVRGFDDPADQGSTDRYYGRPCTPRYYNKWGAYIKKEKMTDDQIREYVDAWENEEDRKDWGSG